MICPKCTDVMQTVDRRGVHIERCAKCKGIFLDGGELEQILAAEQRHYDADPPPYVPEEPAHPAHHGRYDQQPVRYEDPGRMHYSPYPRRKRRMDFLEDLLDFD